MKTLTIIILLALTSAGCASLQDGMRQKNHRLAETCSTNKETYMSATKEDLAYIVLPALQLNGEAACRDYLTFGCTKLSGGWLFIMPFTVIDLPFALLRDIYELPSDVRHGKRIEQCAKENQETEGDS